MGIFSLVKDILNVFNRKCSFCGSKENVKSTIIMTILYYYCNRSSCRARIKELEKRRFYVK